MSDVPASRSPNPRQTLPATPAAPAAHAVPAAHAGAATTDASGAPAAPSASTGHAGSTTAGTSDAPALLILGTGGTIAGAAASADRATGYQAGALSIGEILALVPGLATLVPDGQLASEQVFSIPSEQMDGAHWLQLLARIQAWQGAPRETVNTQLAHTAQPACTTQPTGAALPSNASQPAGTSLSTGEAQQTAARQETHRTAGAIVITHGTDTLEETAFFLSLVLPPDRPVILTGSMRPATALSADGPANLYDACRFALAARAAGIGGVFVQFAGKILRTDAVFKAHANQTDAFGQRFGAPVGWLEGDGPRWAAPEVLSAATAWQGLFASQHPPGSPSSCAAREPLATQDAWVIRNPFAGPGRFTGQGEPVGQTGAPLPRVALVPQYVDADPAFVDWLVRRGHAGLVLAGTGIGTMPAAMRAALATARQQGVMVVRATRVPAGYVPRNTEAHPEHSDDALGFVTAGWLDAPKARILLQRCLAAGLRDAQAIQAVFDRFRP